MLGMDIDEIRRENIRKLQHVAGSANAVAEKVGMSYVQYVNLRDGAKDPRSGKPRGMRKETAWRFEKAFGMSKGWLDLPNEDDLEQSRAGYVSFDLLDVRAAAGDGCEAVDFPEVMQRVNVLESWARQKIGGDLSRIRLITAQGDSMRGTFDDGDVLFVDATVRDFRGEGVYIIYHPSSGVRAKRLQQLMDGTMNIISDGKYTTETATAAVLERMRICGKVVASWRFSPL